MRHPYDQDFVGPAFRRTMTLPHCEQGNAVSLT
jgi:hypothetical protein